MKLDKSASRLRYAKIIEKAKKIGMFLEMGGNTQAWLEQQKRVVLSEIGKKGTIVLFKNGDILILQLILHNFRLGTVCHFKLDRWLSIDILMLPLENLYKRACI